MECEKGKCRIFMCDWFFHENVRLCSVEAQVEREPRPIPQFIFQQSVQSGSLSSGDGLSGKTTARQ